MPAKYHVTSITITVASKQGLPNFSSVENSTTFTFSKADGSPFSEQEAESAALEVSERLRQKVWLDEVAQGARDASACKDAIARMNSTYTTVRNKFTGNGA